jgi:DNA polymerase
LSAAAERTAALLAAALAAPAPPAPAAPAAAAPAAAAPAPALPPLSARSALSAEERCAKLAALGDQVAACTRCPLAAQREHTVFARGNPEAELVFVGEGPGAEEDAQGVPFVGPAGQLLDRMIAAMGFGRDAVYICNVVKCRPPGNRKPTPEEIGACVPYLHEQLALLRPKVLVSLGATALEGLLGWQGRAVSIGALRGVWKVYRGLIPLMPTFHPAFLLRTPARKRDAWDDLKQVMTKLGKSPAKGKV